MQPSPLLPLHHIDLLTLRCDSLQGVSFAVVHGSCSGHGAGVEGLHLVSTKAILLEPLRKSHHVLIHGSRMRSNKVGHQVLLLARFGTKSIKHLLKSIVGPHTWLHHF